MIPFHTKQQWQWLVRSHQVCQRRLCIKIMTAVNVITSQQPEFWRQNATAAHISANLREVLVTQPQALVIFVIDTQTYQRDLVVFLKKARKEAFHLVAIENHCCLVCGKRPENTVVSWEKGLHLVLERQLLEGHMAVNGVSRKGLNSFEKGQHSAHVAAWRWFQTRQLLKFAAWMRTQIG